MVTAQARALASASLPASRGPTSVVRLSTIFHARDPTNASSRSCLAVDIVSSDKGVALTIAAHQDMTAKVNDVRRFMLRVPVFGPLYHSKIVFQTDIFPWNF